MTISLEEVTRRALEDPEVAQAYAELFPKYQSLEEKLRKRRDAQMKLSEHEGTSQTALSRMA